MQSFMIALFTCSVTMSALALLYMAAAPFLSGRYSPRGCYYTWLIVVAGLIIPFRPHVERAVVNVDVPSEMALPITRMGNGGTAVEAAAPVTPPSAFSGFSLWHILLLVWLAGMAVFLVYHAVKHWRFVKLANRWSEGVTEGPALAVLESLRAEMGISGTIGLRICASVGGPMMIGFIRPRILLPKTDFAEDELRFILAHELVHYRRKDLAYKALVLFATAIHWFNPVVYLMAKAIDAQCESSCDDEVVRSTDAETRLQYSETIIGVIKYQSKLRTALSTHFYGGKKGMKKRIFSIMDMRKKKAGMAVLCGMLTLTLGTGFAFAAKAEALTPPEIIKEHIVITPQISVSFVPNPDVYTQYSAFGVTISEDGMKLLYQGKPVRLFEDEGADTEAFYYDESGSANLAVARNAAGEIAGIDSISAQQAQEYYDAFFAEELATESAVQDSEWEGPTKYDQYQPFGITCSAADEILYHNGRRVKLLVDQYADGWLGTFWTDDAGTVNLAVVRDASGQITGIESISDEKAQEYRSAAAAYEQSILNGLDDKIAERMKALYPGN